MAWVRTAAEEAKMPLTSMSILTIAFECATTDWSIGGLVEKLDSGAWHTACWVYAVGAATSLPNKRVKSLVAFAQRVQGSTREMVTICNDAWSANACTLVKASQRGNNARRTKGHTTLERMEERGKC